MNIRVATPDDLPVIHALAHRIWPVAYREILSSDQLTYMLRLFYNEAELARGMTAGEHFFIADAPTGPVGFSGHTHHFGDRTTRLNKLYVDSSDRSSGIGKQLVLAVKRAACEVGDQRITLNVNKYNPAIGFYRYLGFEVVRSEVIDIGSGYVMDDHVMECGL
jgi:ribosomal protein S18 acetylase RimI-like enzyme